MTSLFPGSNPLRSNRSMNFWTQGHFKNAVRVYAVRLFSNRSQTTSKCDKDKKVQPSVSLMFLPHFDAICDLSLNIRTAKNIIFTTIACNLAIWLANWPLSIRVWTTLPPHARVNLSRKVIANQEPSFWEINQSYCEKVIDNACSFFVSWVWSPSEINTFFGVEYCGKKQIESGSALAAPREATTFWPPWWRISLSIRVQTTLNPFRFVKYLFYKIKN